MGVNIICLAPPARIKSKHFPNADPKEMVITKAQRLLSEDRLHADETSAYFENFRQQYQKLRYKKSKSDTVDHARLVKKDDDVMDPVLQCIAALNPVPIEDIDFESSETREPPFKWIVARAQARAEEEAESETEYEEEMV